MAGKIQGLLGGILLATSYIYYTSDDFKKSNTFVSKTLQQTNDLIHNNKDITEDGEKTVPKVLEFQYRPSVKQTIADLWDEQVLGFAKSVYGFDAAKTTSCLVNKLQSLIDDVSK